MNGHEIAKALYQPSRKKKRKRKRIEKVTVPNHWNKDFDSHEQKLKQSNHHGKKQKRNND